MSPGVTIRCASKPGLEIDWQPLVGLWRVPFPSIDVAQKLVETHLLVGLRVLIVRVVGIHTSRLHVLYDCFPFLGIHSAKRNNPIS